MKPKLIFVGAFPQKDKKIFGGNVSACKALINSSFAKNLDLVLIDSTQISNPPPSFFIRLFLSLKRFVYFLYKFEREKPDAVLVFSAAGASMLEKCLMCWYSKIRGVLSLNFPRDGRVLNYSNNIYIKRILPYLFNGSSKVLCQGLAWHNFSVNVLKKNNLDAPIITNWTATDELLNIGLGRKPNILNNSPNFLFVGWLEDHKGIFELIEAVSKISSKYDFKLNIVGSGNAYNKIKELISSFNLENIVFLHGWLDGDDLLCMYKNNDIFILPSWFEGLPNSLIEAMAAKMAVITTKVGSIPDYLIDKHHGILISPKNEREILEAMKNLIENPKLAIDLAENAHELAKTEWSVEQASKKFIECLN